LEGKDVEEFGSEDSARKTNKALVVMVELIIRMSDGCDTVRRCPDRLDRPSVAPLEHATSVSTTRNRLRIIVDWNRTFGE
jgi:hypothetical protein